jgi:phage baseplate assembly protein W
MIKTQLYKDINQFSPADREYSLNERAVYQSVINILQTRKGERLFYPDFGVEIDEYLFENVTGGLEGSILTQIATTIERIENRVRISYPDSEIRIDADNHVLEIKLVFTIQGIEEQTYQLIEAIRF